MNAHITNTKSFLLSPLHYEETRTKLYRQQAGKWGFELKCVKLQNLRCRKVNNATVNIEAFNDYLTIKEHLLRAEKKRNNALLWAESLPNFIFKTIQHQGQCLALTGFTDICLTPSLALGLGHWYICKTEKIKEKCCAYDPHIILIS